MLRRTLQRQQAGGTGVRIDLVECGQIVLARICAGQPEGEAQLRPLLTVARGGHRLSFDGLPYLGKPIHDGVDELGKVRGQSGGRPTRRAGGRERKLAHHVVDMRLGRHQQVGRHLAEQHRVAALLLERIVRPGSE